MKSKSFGGLSLILWLFVSPLFAQTTYPANDVATPRSGYYAFINAKIYKDAKTIINSATLIIRQGKIEAVGINLPLPKDAIIIDCKGKSIYPSFIDIYSDYGMSQVQPSMTTYRSPSQMLSNTKGPYSWNQALKTEVLHVKNFAVNDARAKEYRKLGFGSVLSHQLDGISRGVGLLTTLAKEKENMVILKEKASAHFSFDKGSSTQDYPNSLMGSIALLRQHFLDASWYKTKPSQEGLNLTLQAFNENANLPQIFEVSDKWSVFRANKIASEFGIQYIFKAGGNEYQRIDEIKAIKSSFILPINFPQAMDVEDPNDARFVNVSDLKHWELAPTNPAAFEKAGIPFALTASGLKDVSQFMPNLKIQGSAYGISTDSKMELAGKYKFILGNQTVQLSVTGETGIYKAQLFGKDTLAVEFSQKDQLVNLIYTSKADQGKKTRLSGDFLGNSMLGTGTLGNGEWVSWQATREANADTVSVKKRPAKSEEVGSVVFPFNGYGQKTIPKSETILIKNTTVWTNEKSGILKETDVLIKNGKIAAIGKGLKDPTARVVNGVGKHVTAGIIDEHSHVAASGGINECSQSVTAEVRITDVIDPEDVDMYRQLSGGVTSSHILHGSCNTVGGQTQLLKFRWGQTAEGLKFANWDPFIKFALGENVKRSWNLSNPRFPDTRMGVEQVLTDAFTRARDYEKQGPGKRIDLELEALVEILNHKRFITCHSYVQSEINAMMKVADKFGFTVYTFTHILEGYKVADKMKAHGASASTFSDWWNYKMEVVDAIPQNAFLMQKNGVNVAINSDDAEMARRLNHEAAKSIKYAGMSEEDALKMVTLNPAKMLHVADRVGSLKEGKDADLVIWSDHPLSIYAKSEQTIVDGAVVFDREVDAKLQADLKKEKQRLIQKMILAKKGGSATRPMTPSFREENMCEDDHGHGKSLWDRISQRMILTEN